MFNVKAEDSLRRIDEDMKMICIMKFQIPSYYVLCRKKYGASIRLYELKDKNVKGRETL